MLANQNHEPETRRAELPFPLLLPEQNQVNAGLTPVCLNLTVSVMVLTSYDTKRNKQRKYLE